MQLSYRGLDNLTLEVDLDPVYVSIDQPEKQQ